MVDGAWGESQGTEVPGAHLHDCFLHWNLPPEAGRLSCIVLLISASLILEQDGSADGLCL